jgi:hypothetical protein
MLTMRFSHWLALVEQKLGLELDMTTIDEALRCYGDGWTVDDFAFEVAEQMERALKERGDHMAVQYANARLH